ncbi:MAG: iron-sulfur binding hydrogenase [Spirochaetales bacterium]|uniref:Iron-sulfur binding hydrogenase n=1 Tax=Candidatus Thalassospirochaeta sargassi TaxID=3119039 RepID=A0AAJ1IFS9_9SPIO|nr:iron-sulfur binding hydrogenase [Spirochaetales bacterium]
MKIFELNEKLGFELLTKCPESVITSAYTSDLLSDVMGNAPDDSVLITIQAHKNTIAVASLAGINAIILCNNRKAPEDMLPAAEKECIAILQTGLNQFEASVAVAKALDL